VTSWYVILGVAAGSFLWRVAPLLLLGSARSRPSSDAAIRDAGTAAITALIVAATSAAADDAGAWPPAVLAVTAGAVLAARRAPMIALLLAGGAVYAVAALVTGAITG